MIDVPATGVAVFRPGGGRDAFLVGIAAEDSPDCIAIGLLFDVEILAADSFLIDIPPPQRVRFILSLHENRAVWYRLTNLEAGAEDLSCRIYYFAGTTGGSGTLL